MELWPSPLGRSELQAMVKEDSSPLIAVSADLAHAQLDFVLNAFGVNHGYQPPPGSILRITHQRFYNKG